MDKIRITSIDIFKADISMHEPFRISIMEISSAQNVFIRINTDAGISGYGEASPFWKICGETQGTCLAAARDLALVIKGKDPLDLEARSAELRQFLDNNTTIISAFDMALHDIAAKVANMPLYAFLGGSKRTLVTDMTIGLGDPEYVARKSVEILKQGFASIKVKLGTKPVDDEERIAAIRNAIGPDVPLRVDANQGWDVTNAITTLRALEKYNIQYCEQPVAAWNIAGMARVRSATTIPIMADDALMDHHDAFVLCTAEACDYLNIKLSKSGGLRVALLIESVARSSDRKCMVGCMMESRLGLSAAAHLASARTSIEFCDLDTAYMLSEDPILGGITYEGGEVTLPDEPGLGATVDPDFLDTCESYTV